MDNHLLGASEGNMQVSLTFKFDHPVSAWVLVIGGWFPLQLPGVDVIFLDRNIISALRALAKDPARNDMEAERWWLEHLDRPHNRLNPIFDALEGSKRTVPSFEEFLTELEASNSIIASSLPRAQRVQHDPADHSLYELVKQSASSLPKKCRFLMRVCPILANRVGQKDQVRVLQVIADSAQETGVEPKSLVYLAALSCLYERKDGAEPRIGRGILKPHPNYSESDAYNALADIRALEMLTAVSGIPGPSAGFCTRDKYLAAFWVNLGISNATWKHNKCNYNLTPKPELFPRLDAQGIAALVESL